jgi:hypothetical protein
MRLSRLNTASSRIRAPDSWWFWEADTVAGRRDGARPIVQATIGMTRCRNRITPERRDTRDLSLGQSKARTERHIGNSSQFGVSLARHRPNIIRWRTVGPLLGVLAGALVIGSCSSAPSSAPGSTARATAPHCSLASITVAAKDAHGVGPVQRVTNFGCARDWAYAGIVVGTSAANSFDAVIVLQAHGSRWTVANRATACLKRRVPSSIYGPACTTS